MPFRSTNVLRAFGFALVALSIGAHPAAAQFTPTVDGTIPNGSNNQDEYVTAAPRADNVGDGTAPEAERILFYADDANQTLYVGVRGALPTDSDDGIALWLNFQELDGAAAGTDLSVPGASHYMNNSFKADFEVDYTISMTSDRTLSDVRAGVLKHVGTTASQGLGTTDQSGSPITVDFFSSGSDVTWAFDNSGTGNDQGFEIAIPYSALGVSRAGAMEAFAGVVTSDGDFSSETVPGDLGGVDAGTNPDFGALSGGPFHRTKTFTARFTTGIITGDQSDGSFTTNNTWEATETDGETIPFQGSKVIAGSEAGGRNSYVVFDTDVTLHTFTVDTATDGDGSNVSEIGSGNTLTITDALTLKSETFADGGGTLEMEDGTTVERSGGTIGFSPTFLGSASAVYTAGLTTGDELPTSVSSLRIDASGNTVTLAENVTVNTALELDAGTLGRSGSEAVTLADGSTLRVGTGTMDFTPTVAGGTAATTTYTTGGVTTGPELPAGAAGDVTLRVDAGGIVTLQANTTPTFNGDLTIQNGTLDDNGNTVTINGDATVAGGAAHTSTGGGQLSFSGGSSTHALAGSGTYGTVELNESDDFNNAPEATISGGATITDLTATTGVLEVQAGGATVTSATIDSEAQLKGPLDIGNGATVNGTLVLQSGGSVTGTGPAYADGALLRYAAGTAIDRGAEWSSTGGAGYPEDVELTNSTTLDLSAGGAGTARSIAGALTIGGSSTLNMDNMSAALTVPGALTVDGTLALGSATGGNAEAQGSAVQIGGTVTTNSGRLVLNGSSAQTLSGDGTAVSLGAVQIDNANGVSLEDDLTVGSELRLTSGTLSQTNSETLTLSGGSTVRRSDGALGFTPSFGTPVNVTYTAGLTTGNELSPSKAGTVTVDATGATVMMATGVDPTLNGALTVTSGTLDLNGNDVTIEEDLTNNGTLTIGTATVIFNGSTTQTVSGTVGFHDVAVNGGPVDFGGSSATIGNRLTLNTGGGLTGTGPAYADGTLLRYAAGTAIDRGPEWSSTSGAGYPEDVELTNSTTLDLSAGGVATARSIDGALTIGGSSTLDMDDMSAALTVPGALTVDGTLALGSATGGNAKAQGSTVQVGGTVTTNSGRLVLNGSSAQTLSGDGTAVSLGAVQIENANGVSLEDDLTVGSELRLTSGTLSQTNSETLTLSGGSTVRRSDGALGFTPSFGTPVNVTYTAGLTTGAELSSSNAGTLTVDATDATVTLAASTDPALQGDLTIQNGTFNDNGHTLTVNGNATVNDTHVSTSGGQLTFAGGSSTHTLAGSGTYGTVELNESGDFSNAPEATISEGASFASLTATDGALEVQSSGATVSGAVTVDSELQVSGALDIGGDLTVNGTIAASGQTITLNGSSTQTLGGTISPFSLGSLTLNNSNGATLETDLSIAGTLDLTSGTLSRSGSETLTLSGGSTVRRSNGAIDFTPSFGGTVDVTYTAALTTGPELPSTSTGVLTVDASSATVTVAGGTNPTVSDALTVTNGTLDLNGSDVTLTGSLTESGTLVDNASTGGTVTFDAGGTQSVTGTPTFANVTLNTTADFGSSPTVEGTLTLNPGGSVATSAPNYSGSATLRYETGTTTNRGLEWSSTSGAGYPTDVTLANGTTLDLSAGDATAARSIAGALTIGGSSTLDMDDLSAALTIGNGATVNGTLTLGSASGGDLSVSGGDLTVNGTLTANGRTVTLSGSSTAQTLGGTVSSLSLGGLTVDNANGVTLTTGVDLSKTLTLTSGTLTSNGNLTLESTAGRTAAVAGAGSGTVIGDVTMERHVGFPDDGTNNSHWRFLSSPLSVMLDDAGTAGNSDNLLSNVWTQSTGSGSNAQVSAGNATIFTYAENTNVNNNLNEGWSEVATLNDSPVSPGDGYLTYLFENNNPVGPDGFPVTLSVTGSLPSNETDGTNAAPSLTFTDDGDSDAQNGWNLVANPFAAPLDWESVVDNGLEQLDKTIYVWDPESGQYATYTADGGGTGGSGSQNRYIAPFQSFFVKAGPPPVEPPDPPTKSGALQPGMTLTSADKSAGATPSLKSTPPDSSAPRITLQLRAASDSTGETTVVRYTNDAYTGKDRLDAYQLKPFRAEYALLASGMQGRDALFDLQSRPVPTVRDTLDLALDVTASGTYTLDAAALEGLPGGWKVILEHEETGARHDLGAGEAVTFDYTAPESKASDPSQAGPAAVAPTVATTSDSTDALPSYRLYVGPQAALPVELASFDATADARTVSLTWRTASETNNAGFTVERRAGDTGSWVEVGTREGAGTTTQPQTYRFRDASVPFAAESMTYRLRQADLDGTTTLSDTLAVSLAAPETTTLRPPFPNPVRQQATIRYTLPRAQDVTIALYDVLGRRVRTLTQDQQTAGRHEQTVDLSGLSSGAYFVRMRTGDATHTRRLTVVQ